MNPPTPVTLASTLDSIGAIALPKRYKSTFLGSGKARAVQYAATPGDRQTAKPLRNAWNTHLGH